MALMSERRSALTVAQESTQLIWAARVGWMMWMMSGCQIETMVRKTL